MTRYAAFLIDDLMPSRVSDVPFGCYEIDSLPSQVGVAICHGLEVFPEYRGKGLVAFGSRKDGCSLYLMSTSTAGPLSDELSGFEIKGTTVWFTPSKPLTLKALRAIVKHRMAEVDARLDGTRR